MHLTSKSNPQAKRSVRSTSIACLASLAIVSLAFAESPNEKKQTWRTRIGTYAIVASYVSQTDSDVVLSKDDGSQVTVPKSRLSEENVAWLARKHLQDDDRLSDEQTKSMREALVRRHESATGAFVAIHNLYKSSPIAGLLAGVSLAAIENEPKKAIAILTEAGRRIKARREIDSAAHRDTLISILNNIAVCELMLNRPSPAANSLVAAFGESGPTANGAILHNAKLLLQASDKRGKEVMIASSILSDLRLRTAQATSTDDVSRFGNLLIYTTLTSPQETSLEPVGAESDETTKVSSAPDASKAAVTVPTTLDGLSLLGFGSGFAVADDWVMTNRHVAEKMASRQALAVWNESIAARPNSNGPLVVSQVLMANSDDHDLALLRVENLGAKPLALCAIQPTEGSDLVVMGYPKPEDFGLSLMVSGGVLNKIHPATRDLWTDAKIDGGNSGGPMLSLDGAVAGIAKASYLGGKTLESHLHAEKRGLGVFALEARAWIARTAPALMLVSAPDSKVLMSKADLVSMTRDSVYSILIFGSQPVEADIQVQSSAGGRGVASGGHDGSEFLPNVWCLACGGRGFMSCLNPRCQKGAVPVKQRVIVSSSQLGGPVYGERTSRASCSTCAGAGGRRCTSCNQGKVASWNER